VRLCHLARQVKGLAYSLIILLLVAASTVALGRHPSPAPAVASRLSVSQVDGRAKVSALGPSRSPIARWLAGGSREAWSGLGGQPFLLADRLGLAQDTDPAVYDVFSDASFSALGRAGRRFRLLADYDAAMPGARAGELGRVARLIAGAANRGSEILVTLRNPPGRRPPSASRYARGAAELIRLFGDRVAFWGTWNEPSLTWRQGPTPGNAAKLAAYYDRLRTAAGEKRVTGPDFVDDWTRRGPDPNGRFSDDKLGSGLVEWVRGYRLAGGGFGVAAALHPYGAITLRRSDSIRQYRSLLPPGTDVWLTEAGARVRREHRGLLVDWKPVDGLSQGMQVEFLLDDIAALPGVRRIYYYGLREPNWWASFDTGLLDNFGQRRAAWSALCEHAMGDCRA
jgi:hypothetical protein